MKRLKIFLKGSRNHLAVIDDANAPQLPVWFDEALHTAEFVDMDAESAAAAQRRAVFQAIDTQVDAIANLADAKLFLKRFCKAVVRQLDLDS